MNQFIVLVIKIIQIIIILIIMIIIIIGRAVKPVPVVFVTLCNYWHYGSPPNTGWSQRASQKSGPKKKRVWVFGLKIGFSLKKQRFLNIFL